MHGVASRYPSASRADVSQIITGARLALVGSGPGALENAFGKVDSFDVVVRVNNYKLGPPGLGRRTDVFFSYFGNAIKKRPEDLKRDGVRLCMAKCPDAKAIESPWHAARGKTHGTDFRWIYDRRANWWPTPVYIPSLEDFLEDFELLGRHVPTTGFSALLTLLRFSPAHVFLTGFDFFTSRIHNVNERWIPGDPHDPIRHLPELELEWLRKRRDSLPLSFDGRLTMLMDDKLRRRTK